MRPYAAFYGQPPVDWHFCAPADPQAKGAVERLQGYLESNLEPGRCFANDLDFQLQQDARVEKANARTHKTLEEFDVTFQRSVRKTVFEHLGQLDRRPATPL